MKNLGGECSYSRAAWANDVDHTVFLVFNPVEVPLSLENPIVEGGQDWPNGTPNQVPFRVNQSKGTREMPTAFMVVSIISNV